MNSFFRISDLAALAKRRVLCPDYREASAACARMNGTHHSLFFNNRARIAPCLTSNIPLQPSEHRTRTPRKRVEPFRRK